MSPFDPSILNDGGRKERLPGRDPQCTCPYLRDALRAELEGLKFEPCDVHSPSRPWEPGYVEPEPEESEHDHLVRLLTRAPSGLPVSVGDSAERFASVLGMEVGHPNPGRDDSYDPPPAA